MILKSSGSLMSASVFSAVGASLCCIVPVIGVLAGTGSIAANFTFIEPVRPYLIGLSISLLGIAWYSKLKVFKTKDMDCNCETKKSSFLQSKTFLSIVTVFAVLVMAFPLYAKIFNPNQKVQSVEAVKDDNKKQVKFNVHGMTCVGCEVEINNQLSKLNGVLAYKTSYAHNSSLVTYDASKVDIKTIHAAIYKTGYTVKRYEMINAINTTSDISFYEAPLVCEAAPSVGCGSKAKFMLLDFEKYSNEIESAWLNRTGTAVAIKWKPNVAAVKKPSILEAVSTNHSIELTEIAQSEISNEAKTFPKGWYRSIEVDRLSKEEAGIIAENTIAEYKKKGLMKPAFESKFKDDIEKIYADLFLSISSYKDLTQVKYNEIEEKIQKAGEKYVGKGKMPKVELCTLGTDSCAKDKFCYEGKSCCEQK